MIELPFRDIPEKEDPSRRVTWNVIRDLGSQNYQTGPQTLQIPQKPQNYKQGKFIMVFIDVS